MEELNERGALRNYMDEGAVPGNFSNSGFLQALEISLELQNISFVTDFNFVSASAKELWCTMIG